MSFLKGIPFTYHWIVRRAIGGKVRTVLDLGCGEGDFMKDIAKGEDWEITGVELFENAVAKAEKSGVYKEVIKADVTKLPKSVLDKKLDVVFCSQVLEHLDKEEGKKVLKEWEKLAKKRIVISTPVGFIEYEPIEKKKEDNPLQKHKSGWQPEELQERGYLVRGQGLKLIYGKNGVAKKTKAGPMLILLGFISFLFSPLVYFFPKLGLIMVSRKDINAS